MILLALPISTALSDVEQTIVRAFLRNSAGPRRPYAAVYRSLAQSLHVRVVEIKAIEQAMVARIGASQAERVSLESYGHGVTVAEAVRNVPAPAIG